MLKKNQHVTIDVKRWSKKGLASAVYQGKVILIPDVIPGEKIAARIQKVGPNVAFAKATDILKPSPTRKTPPCPIAGQCGGCQLQHISYEAQVAYKKDRFLQILSQLKMRIPPVKIHAADMEFQYRNKAQFAISPAKEGHRKIGFFAARSQRVVDCAHCVIQSPMNNNALTLLRQYKDLMPETLAHVLCRSGDNGILLTLVSTQRDKDAYRSLCNNLSRHKDILGIGFSYNPSADWTILGDRVEPIIGENRVRITLQKQKFYVSPSAFFQAHSKQTDDLLGLAKARLHVRDTDHLWDLYCGAGSFALAFAAQVKQVIGIERDETAIADAKKNAASNGIANATFVAGDVSELVKTLDQPCDHIIVDPPRQGLEKDAIKIMTQLAPRQMLYVSCNPDTLQRDLAIFLQRGYVVKSCDLIDMFPQTYHIESMTVLEKT